VGHYSRRDVFTLQFNDQALGPVKRLKEITETSALERALPQATATTTPSLPLKAPDLTMPKLTSVHENIDND
jgi:hypothetical protein